MTSRELPWIALRTAAGVCSLFVSLHGIWNIYGLDFRIDTVISVLYCLIPFLSFFLFVFVTRVHLELLLHATLAAGYLAAYTLLNWRSCIADGYCTTVGSTIGMTLRTKPVLAALGVVVFCGIALFVDVRPVFKRESQFSK